MTVFEKFKEKNIDEFAEWLAEYCMFDTAPWWKWWDKNYCSKCKEIVAMNEDGHVKGYAYCELNGNCRFFNGLDEIPDDKRTIKMWLESEGE